MKRFIALVLIAALSLALFAGCGSAAPSVKIDVNNSNYTVRPNTTAPFESAAPSAQTETYLEKYMTALSASIDSVPAEVYTFDFSNVAFVNEEEARSFLIPALSEKYGAERIVEKTTLRAGGIWAVPTASGFENDVKEIWISAYENADKNLEFVVDIKRNGQTLRNARFVETASGSLKETMNELRAGYDGAEPPDAPALVPEETASAKTLYFDGRLQKNAIFEKPVFGSVDFRLRIDGTPVEGGSLPGGFAGGFEGTVTIDGYAYPLTLDASGLEIPVGMVTDPSQYYIAFSQVAVANPQDTTTYRNVYFIKKDLTSVVGLYSYYKSAEYCDWFETSRVTAATFDAKVKTDNEKLTALYSEIIVASYGTRKEYNYLLAPIFNMFIGVDKSYLKPNLTKGISSVSKDIRDYSEALKDEKVSRKGENGFYFFPDGRSMVVRLFAYDGASALVAIDFSSKQDDGYGGLYLAEYTNSGWELTALQNTRIK